MDHNAEESKEQQTNFQTINPPEQKNIEQRQQQITIVEVIPKPTATDRPQINEQNQKINDDHQQHKDTNITTTTQQTMIVPCTPTPDLPTPVLEEGEITQTFKCHLPLYLNFDSPHQLQDPTKKSMKQPDSVLNCIATTSVTSAD